MHQAAGRQNTSHTPWKATGQSLSAGRTISLPMARQWIEAITTCGCCASMITAAAESLSKSICSRQRSRSRHMKEVKPGLLEGMKLVEAPPPREAMGFFTDSTLCIGCKACEVACKQWNGLPADGMEWSGQSYDNTRTLSATTWR